MEKIRYAGIVLGQYPENTMNQDEEILRRVLRGDQVAWMALFSHYGPVVERIARANRSMGSYRGSEDDIRNVMAQVFERLWRDDYRALRMFSGWRDKNPGKAFQDWLTIVTVNVVRNYISSKLGSPSQDGASVKQLVNTLADALSVDGDELLIRPHITTKETAQRIVEYARDNLADDQFAVLAAWLKVRRSTTWYPSCTWPTREQRIGCFVRPWRDYAGGVASALFV
jgi:DNA-directed RNA polymerase specialized sigma24 family protein